MTPQELGRLAELEHFFSQAPQAAPEPERPIGMMERTGRHLLNFVPDAMGRAADTLTSVPKMLLGAIGVESGNIDEGTDARIVDVPAPRTGGELATDVILGGVAPELPGLIAGGAGATKLLRSAGAGQKLAAIGGDVAAGAASGARQGVGEMAAQAGEFGLLGVASQFVKPLRPILRAAVQSSVGAGVGVGGQVLRGHDPLSKESLIQTGVMAAFPVAQEAVGGGLKAILRRKQDAPTPVHSELPKAETPQGIKVLDSMDNGDGSFTTTILDAQGKRQTFRGEQQYPAVGKRLAPVADDLGAVAPTEGDLLSMVPKRTAPEPSRPPTTPVEPAVPGLAPVAQESLPVVASPQGGRLKPLRKSEAGAASAVPLQYLGAASLGAVAGPLLDPENPGRGAAIGAAVGMGALGAGRGLKKLGPMMEEGARKLMGGEKSAVGSVTRFLEKNANLHKDQRMMTVLEQARGTVDEMARETGTVIKSIAQDISALDPVKRIHVDAYLRSDRSAGAEAMLKASPVPANIQEGLLKASKIKSDLQAIIASGERNPEKIKLINDTLGLWQTQAYRAYVTPKKWSADPILKERVVQEQLGGKVLAPGDEAMIRKDVDDWLKEVVSFGGDFSRMQNEGKSRISQSLYKERKLLTPGVKAVLGEITDPFEREILSISKLAKSAVSAKVISDVMKLPDSKGMRFALTEAEWKSAMAAAEAAGDRAKIYDLKGYTRAPEGPGMGGLGQVPNLKNGHAMMVQRQVLDTLRAGPGHIGIDWEQGLLGAMAKLNRIPKASMTLYNPGTWVRNYAQAGLQGLSAGMAPHTLVKNAVKLRRDPVRLKWAKEDGILDAHYGAGEFRRQASGLDDLLKPWYRRPLSTVHEAVKKGYGIPDQAVRGAAYMKFLDEGLAKGMPSMEARRYAVEMVNRYTHNYSQVSQAVGALRNIPFLNPFLTYTAEMARIIKNLAEDVVVNETGRRWQSAFALLSLFGLGGLVKSAMTENNLDAEGKAELAKIMELLPPAMRTQLRAPVTYDKATGKMEMRNIAPWLPAGDFVGFAKALIDGDTEAVVANNPVASLQRSPIINMVSELATGRDVYTGKENEGTFEKVARPILKQFAPPMFPGNYRWEQMEQAFTPNEKGGLGITDPRSGRTETPRTFTHGLLGDSLATVSRKSLLRRKDAELDREMTSARSLLRKTTRSDAAQEVKQAAILRFKERAQEIQSKRRELFRTTQQP